MKNLEKQHGRDQVGHGGWNRQAQGIGKLSYLNLVRVQMDDTLVTLIGMENLRRFICTKWITEDAMARLGRG